MLDRKVAEELAELKKSMLGSTAQAPPAAKPGKVVPKLVNSIT